METEQGGDEKFMQVATESAAIAAGELIDRGPVVSQRPGGTKAEGDNNRYRIYYGG